jgi:hypothetical protein
VGIGSAAGAAAALAVKLDVAVQDVPINQLHAAIAAAGPCIHWPQSKCHDLNAC